MHCLDSSQPSSSQTMCLTITAGNGTARLLLRYAFTSLLWSSSSMPATLLLPLSSPPRPPLHPLSARSSLPCASLTRCHSAVYLRAEASDARSAGEKRRGAGRSSRHTGKDSWQEGKESGRQTRIIHDVAGWLEQCRQESMGMEAH